VAVKGMAAKSGRLPRGEDESKPLGALGTREHPPAHPTYSDPALLTDDTFAEIALSGIRRGQRNVGVEAVEMVASPRVAESVAFEGCCRLAVMPIKSKRCERPGALLALSLLSPGPG
jgi:hypothetical protein